MSLKDRLEEVLREMRWSERDLIEKSGASRSAVAQWLGKGSKEIQSIKLSYALALERETGFSAEWIANGKLPKRTNVQVIAKQDQDSEHMTMYAAVLALLSSHPHPDRLLVAFDGIVSMLSARGELREAALAALQRLRDQLVRQAETAARSNRR